MHQPLNAFPLAITDADSNHIISVTYAFSNLVLVVHLALRSQPISSIATWRRLNDTATLRWYLPFLKSTLSPLHVLFKCTSLLASLKPTPLILRSQYVAL
jgi:hypothetical protein